MNATITINPLKPIHAGVALPCALTQGAVSRRYDESVVLLAPAAAPFRGGAVDQAMRSGTGSRSWGPPV